MMKCKIYMMNYSNASSYGKTFGKTLHFNEELNPVCYNLTRVIEKLTN